MSSSNSNTINESLSESPYISNNQNKSDEDSQNSKASIITNSIEMNYFENIDFTKLKELNSKCVKLIFENRVDISLEMLKKIESFLESNLLESKLEIDKKFLIIFLNNLACCYQKFKDQGNCLTYLEGVIYHYDKELEKKYKIVKFLILNYDLDCIIIIFKFFKLVNEKISLNSNDKLNFNYFDVSLFSLKLNV